jgi:hypothetical protein
MDTAKNINYKSMTKMRIADKKENISSSQKRKSRQTTYGFHTEVYREPPAAMGATNYGRCGCTLWKSEVMLQGQQLR